MLNKVCLLGLAAVVVAQPSSAQDLAASKYKAAATALNSGNCPVAVPLLQEYRTLKRKQLYANPKANTLISDQIMRCRVGMRSGKLTSGQLISRDVTIKGAGIRDDIRPQFSKGISVK